MQAVKLTIYGEFWDTHIYSGRLFLFCCDGGLLTVDWDSLVDELPLPPELRLAAQCSFSRSDYLYGGDLAPFFEDVEIKALIQKKFERLASSVLELSSAELRPFVSQRQDTPFPFPHTDVKIYANKMYVASEKGVSHANCDKRVKGVSRNVIQDWDCPVLSVAAYSGTLALAAGEEGLFEKRVGVTWWKDERDENKASQVRRIADANCGQCEWTYYSIYGSSHVGEGYMASYSMSDETIADSQHEEFYIEEGRVQSRRHVQVRHFEELISSSRIFEHRGFSWANKDKLYQADRDAVRVVRYQPWAEEQFTRLGTLPLGAGEGDIVSAGVAVFGTVIEYDSSLVVLLSDGTPLTIAGEPIRWRVFPQSKHYGNQLHVVYEDRLEVLSFNHDYLVDQETKQSGIKPI